MSADSALVGYVVGGIPVLIGGMGLLRGMEFLGLPPVVAGVGVVTTAFGVAETFGTIVNWVARGGRKLSAATKNPVTKKRRHQQLGEVLTFLLFLSGPMYWYALELQFLPREQWLIHILTSPPFVVAAYLIGGPLCTMLFVCGRFMLVEYCNERVSQRLLCRWKNS